MQNMGLGQQLLDWAIAHVTDQIMSNVGCRYLIVDSKQESIRFYEKNGFILVESSKDEKFPMMYIDLHQLNSK